MIDISLIKVGCKVKFDRCEPNAYCNECNTCDFVDNSEVYEATVYEIELRPNSHNHIFASIGSVEVAIDQECIIGISDNKAKRERMERMCSL